MPIVNGHRICKRVVLRAGINSLWSTVDSPLMKIRLQDSVYMMQDMGVKDRENDRER